jgi:7-cyano-7-deazaguanine reductase
LVIDYVPKARLVESKSLKLYLASFRDHRGFHEACTLSIAKKISGGFSGTEHHRSRFHAHPA